MFANLPPAELFKTNDDLFRKTVEAIIQKYSSLSDPGVDICLNTMTYRTGRGSVSINSSDGEREFEVLKGRIQAEGTIVDLDDQESDTTVESEVDEEEFRISFRKEAEKSHSCPSPQPSVDNLSHSFLSQPEEEDEELERTLSSHGGTLLDVYPSMLSQIGQACRRQHVKDTARAVLEKYRKRRQQTPNSSFSIRHAGQTDLNRSIRTSENFLNFLKNKPKPSPFKRSGSESAACFFSPRRGTDESGGTLQSPSGHLKRGAMDFSLSTSNSDQTYDLQSAESTFQAPPSSSVTRSPRRGWCSPSKASGDHVLRGMSPSSTLFHPSAFLSQKNKSEKMSHIYARGPHQSNTDQTYNLQPEELTFQSRDHVPRRMSSSSHPTAFSSNNESEKTSYSHSIDFTLQSSLSSSASNPDQTYNLQSVESTFQSGDHVPRRMSLSSRPFHPSASSLNSESQKTSQIYSHSTDSTLQSSLRSGPSKPDQTYDLQSAESIFQAPSSSSVTRSPRRVWCSPSKAAGDQVLRRMSPSSRPFPPSAFLSQENKSKMKSHIYAHGSHPSNPDPTYNLQSVESTFQAPPSSSVTHSPRRVWCSPSKASGDQVLRRMSPSSRPFPPSAFLPQEIKPEKTSQIHLLIRRRSSSGPPSACQQNDAEFNKLYHHFICRGASSPSRSCHLCEAQSSQSKISSNMSGLGLTPMRPQLKKRLRPLESEESQRIKRFRESRSPPKRLLSISEASEEQSRSRGFLLQCPSPHFLHGAGSLRKTRQSNLKKYQNQSGSVGSDSPRGVNTSTANINKFSSGKFSLSPSSFSRRRLLYDACQ